MFLCVFPNNASVCSTSVCVKGSVRGPWRRKEAFQWFLPLFCLYLYPLVKCHFAISAWGLIAKGQGDFSDEWERDQSGECFNVIGQLLPTNACIFPRRSFVFHSLSLVYSDRLIYPLLRVFQRCCCCFRCHHLLQGNNSSLGSWTP